MLKLENICKSYPNKSILDHFSLKIESGNITCLLGPSGIGKTTILKIISGLTDYEGAIIDPPKKIAYIFQEDRLLFNRTVYENLTFVLEHPDPNEIVRVLQLLEIESKKDAYPDELSGGEAKRVAIARAFLYGGDLLLMDEPFTSLGNVLQQRLIEALVKLWQEKKTTVLVVTHDLDEALLLGGKIVVLGKGGSKEEFVLDAPFPRKEIDFSMRQAIINALIESERNST